MIKFYSGSGYLCPVAQYIRFSIVATVKYLKKADKDIDNNPAFNFFIKVKLKNGSKAYR